MHGSQDMFTFIIELEELRDCSNVLVPFVVSSLLTNNSLNKTTESALDNILSINPGVNNSRKNLKKLFQFATSETL